ncbi:hypothetical protein Ancab_016706 [Ancistrocladus abbreviatus]
MPKAKAISRRAQSPLNPRMTPLLLCSSIRTGSPRTLVSRLSALGSGEDSHPSKILHNRLLGSCTEELKGAKAIIDGNLVIEDEPCTSDGLREVELLLPLMKDISRSNIDDQFLNVWFSGLVCEARSRKEIVGVLFLTGSVCSYEFLNSKESFSQVLDEIKFEAVHRIAAEACVRVLKSSDI